MEFILLSIGLGLAGIDPLGALIVASAVAAGMKKRQVATFALVVFGGTVAMGVALSLGFGASTTALVEKFNYLPDGVWVAVNLAVIALLWGRALKRILLKKSGANSDAANPDNKQNKWLKRGIWALSGFFLLTTLADPSYLALIAAAGHQQSFWLALVGHTIWVLVSQFMLFVLVGAVMLGKHQPVVAKMKLLQKRHGQKIGWVLTGIIFMVGMVFLVDLASFWASGSWTL